MPDPQYRQVADAIRDAIGRGEYPPGTALPSQPELAERFGTTPATVNYALRVLRAEGLVRARQGGGGGTFVRPIPLIRRRAVARYQRGAREAQNGRGAFDTEIRRQGMTPRSDVEVAIVEAPAAVADVLGTGRVVMRKRRMYADDIPVQLAPSYIPADIAEGTVLAERDTGPGGMLSRLADLGHAEVRFTEEVRIRRATDEELGVPGARHRRARDGDLAHRVDRGIPGGGGVRPFGAGVRVGARLRMGDGRG